ncbi:tigger transposable element-derived protein 1-like [Palaemon carinicauda]|uniref:tigger transposable element-derived protein 1-like n=1 Tax=Palaemon carinicauda TaxID=392227 RepID=UPI0035B5C8C2
MIICEKARGIYDDLKVKQAAERVGTSMPAKIFKASCGWLDNFRKRIGIHSVVRHGEAASSGLKAAADYVKTFASAFAEQGYTPQQLFNCDETGFFWKKMPRRTFLPAEEKRLPNHKPTKDRLTLGLRTNASGDCKVEPLLVNHSEYPRAFKIKRILKEKLQVVQRANAKNRVTWHFFTVWVNLCFGLAVKKYLAEKSLSMKCLLGLDNASCHPPGLEEDLLDEYRFIKILYLPPNTTPLLWPMDQQEISSFKKLYMKHLLKMCFDGTDNTNLTLREFWKEHFNIVHC